MELKNPRSDPNDQAYRAAPEEDAQAHEQGTPGHQPHSRHSERIRAGRPGEDAGSHKRHHSRRPPKLELPATRIAEPDDDEEYIDDGWPRGMSCFEGCLLLFFVVAISVGLVYFCMSRGW